MILLILSLACGGDEPAAAISGLVVDHAGRPLEGVQVSVLNSAYQATTGPDGRYLVPFAPGRFSVRYARQGHTSASVEHDIQAQVRFPAAEITLYPMPPTPGIYLLGEGGLTSIPSAALDRQVLSSGWMSSETKTFCTAEGEVTAPAGRLRFIDTSPSVLLPAKAGGYGLILHEDGDELPYNGLFKDQRETVGDEGLVLRSFDALSGNYAFIPFTEKKGGERRVDLEAGCLPFKVL